MLKTRSVALLLLILGAGIILGVLFNHSLMTKAVEAQQNVDAKWEHCQVTGARYASRDNFGKSVSYATIEYYQQTGIKREEVKTEEILALSQAFARLGEQGWQMAAIEHVEGSSPIYHFKRIKR
jgi:hypothetical protein